MNACGTVTARGVCGKPTGELYRLRKERLMEPSGKIREKRQSLIRKGGKPS